MFIRFILDYQNLAGKLHNNYNKLNYCLGTWLVCGKLFMLYKSKPELTENIGLLTGVLRLLTAHFMADYMLKPTDC